MGVGSSGGREGALRVASAGAAAPGRRHHPARIPGFPTDLQAQFMALLSVADGNSFVTEKIYPERFIHVAELQRMRAQIRKEGPTRDRAGGRPPLRLPGDGVRPPGVRGPRGGRARGPGPTVVERVYHIDRGYERIEEKLAGLGARIRRAD